MHPTACPQADSACHCNAQEACTPTAMSPSPCHTMARSTTLAVTIHLVPKLDHHDCALLLVAVQDLGKAGGHRICHGCQARGGLSHNDGQGSFDGDLHQREAAG